jgi:hypothetical protein
MLPYKLSFKHHLLLIGILAVIFVWLRVDQTVLPTVPGRFAALIILILGLLTGFFFIVKSKEPSKMAGYLSLLVGSFAVTATLIQHVIIRFDISWKPLMICAVAFLSPFVPAWIYRKLKS